MWKLCAFVMLSACAATTMSQSQCNVADINACTTSLVDSFGNGTANSDAICRAASKFVMCLNRLTSCIDNPAFTQARQMMESITMDNMCPEVFQSTIGNSAGASVIATAYLLVALLTLCIFA